MLTTSRLAWVEAWEGDLVPSSAALRSAARVEARVHSTRYYGRDAVARLPEVSPETRRDVPQLELKVVTRRRARWGVLLLALVFAGLVLAVSVVVPVLVQSAATGIESSVGRLEAKRLDLTAATSALSAQVSAMSSPERVAELANQLGLQPAQSIHYLQAGPGMMALEGDTTVAGR